MVIRKLGQKKILNAKFIFWFVLICLGTYILLKFFIGITQKFTHTPKQDLYTLGASLTFSGKILVDNNFPNYTHSLITSAGKKIGLKSTTFNLNEYLNKNIELVGKVKKYLKLTPIIAVDIIKIPDQSLIINGNRYLFINERIYLDFSTQPQLTAIQSGNNIQIWSNDTPVVSIERFVCSKILKTNDCSYLITSYIQTNKDTFQSYRGYTFYKHGTGFWTMFDDNLFGFLFRDISDDMILDISTMFRLVNTDFVVANKSNLIQSNCQNEFSQLRSIDSDGTITYHDPYVITLGLKGNDKKKDPVTCRISFDVRNNRNVVDVQYN